MQFLYYSALSLPITCRTSLKCFTPVPRGAELSSPSWWGEQAAEYSFSRHGSEETNVGNSWGKQPGLGW